MVILKGENEMAKRRNNVNTKPATEEVNTTENFKTEPEAVAEEREPDVLHAKVANCKKVRARKNPTTEEDNVVDELEEGKAVIVLDSSNPDWTRVELAGGTRAWIMSKYLEVI